MSSALKQNNDTRIRVFSVDIGIRNLSLVNLEFNLENLSFDFDNPDPNQQYKLDWKSVTITNWTVVDILKDNDCDVKQPNTVKLPKLQDCIYGSLLKRQEFFRDANLVIIEDQLVASGFGQETGGNISGSTRNKCISHMIYMFLKCFYGFYLKIPNPTMVMVSPRLKLKVCLNFDNFFNWTFTPFVSTKTKKGRGKKEKKTQDTKIQLKLPSSKNNNNSLIDVTLDDHKDVDKIVLVDSINTVNSVDEKKLLQRKEFQEYKQRKNCSVEIAEIVLQHVNVSPHVQQQFNSKEKQDDMADCLLQAIYYLQNNTELPSPPKKSRKRKSNAVDKNSSSDKIEEKPKKPKIHKRPRLVIKQDDLE